MAREVHRTDTRLGAGADEPGTTPRPSRVTHDLKIFVPSSWPEAVAYTCGRRLYRERADEVWTWVRAGLNYDERLLVPEREARMVLALKTWERWLRLGWQAQARHEEAG